MTSFYHTLILHFYKSTFFHFSGYVSEMIAPEARALERTCARLVGLLSQREKNRQLQFRASLQKAWNAVAMTKKKLNDKHYQEIKSIKLNMNVKLTNSENQLMNQIQSLEEHAVDYKQKMELNLVETETKAKTAYDRGRDQQQAEMNRITTDLNRRESILSEKEIVMNQENVILRERILHLESEARPEALAESRHAVTLLQHEVEACKEEMNALEINLNTVENEKNDTIVLVRNEHEKRLLQLRNAHEERLTIIQAKTRQLSTEHGIMLRTIKMKHSNALVELEKKVRLEYDRENRRYGNGKGNGVGVGVNDVLGGNTVALRKERSEHRLEVQRLRRMLERASRGASSYMDEEDDDDDEDEEDENGMEDRVEEEDEMSDISVVNNNNGAVVSPIRTTARRIHGLNALVENDATLQRIMPRLSRTGSGSGLAGLERSGIDLVNDSDLSSNGDGADGMDVLKSAIEDGNIQNSHVMSRIGKKKNRLLDDGGDEGGDVSLGSEEEDGGDGEGEEDEFAERSLPNIRVTRRGSVIITQQQKEKEAVVQKVKLGPYSSKLDSYLLQETSSSSKKK